MVILDDVEREVTAGDVIEIRTGCKHTIRAKSVLKLIEVQLGKDISSDDKIKFDRAISSIDQPEESVTKCQ